jgi:iron complex transport system substrate-binding protein
MPNSVASISIPAIDILVALERPVQGLTTYQGERPVYLGEAVVDAIDYGEMDNPNFELLTAAGADLIIGMTRYNAPFEEEFAEIGAFIAYDSITIADSLRAVEGMATALGAKNEGVAMNASFQAQMDDYAARAPSDVTAMMIWAYQDFLFGYQDNLMPTAFFPILGATNVLGFNEDAESPEEAFVMLEAEDILALDPDVILVFSSHGSAMKTNPAYERLSAVQNERVYAIGQQYSQAAGPIARRVVLEEIAHLLYPKTFAVPADLPADARAVPLSLK